MAKDIKEIEKEISRLMEIRYEVLYYKNALISNNSLRVISNDKFNQWLSENKLDKDLLYFILDPEIGQYIEGYIE